MVGDLQRTQKLGLRTHDLDRYLLDLHFLKRVELNAPLPLRLKLSLPLPYTAFSF